MEAGLGPCPASRALLYLLQFDPHATPCPATGTAWEPGAASASSRHQAPKLTSKAPAGPALLGNQGTLGLGITTDGREVSKEQAWRTHGALQLVRAHCSVPVPEELAQNGWLPSWTCLVSSQTGPRAPPPQTAQCSAFGQGEHGTVVPPEEARQVHTHLS